MDRPAPSMTRHDNTASAQGRHSTKPSARGRPNGLHAVSCRHDEPRTSVPAHWLAATVRQGARRSGRSHCTVGRGGGATPTVEEEGMHWPASCQSLSPVLEWGRGNTRCDRRRGRGSAQQARTRQCMVTESWGGMWIRFCRWTRRARLTGASPSCPAGQPPVIPYWAGMPCRG